MPRDNATEMGELSSSMTALKDRLVELTKQLDEVEKQKKAANKQFNDEIKDIKYEIDVTIKLIRDQEETNE